MLSPVGVGKECSPINRGLILKGPGRWSWLGLRRVLKETIWMWGLGGCPCLFPCCLKPAVVSSGRVGSALPRAAWCPHCCWRRLGRSHLPPGISWAPKPAPEPPHLSGVYGIEATTLWDLACFPFCSQLSGLHGPCLQVYACPSPTVRPHGPPPAWPLFSSAELPVLCLSKG